MWEQSRTQHKEAYGAIIIFTPLVQGSCWVLKPLTESSPRRLTSSQLNRLADEEGTFFEQLCGMARVLSMLQKDSRLQTGPADVEYLLMGYVERFADPPPP